MLKPPKFKILGFLLAAMVVIAGVITLAHPKQQTLPASGLSSYCGNGAEGFKAHLTSSVRLNHKFLGRVPTPHDIEDAIAEQLGFLRGIFSNRYKLEDQTVAFAGSWNHLQILESREEAYGLQMRIDTPKPYPELPPKAYIEAAKMRGSTEKDDAATFVTYLVEIDAVACAMEGKAPRREFTPELPVDPYLAYWIVAPEKRQQHIWRTAQNIVNPCSDNEMADLPSPEYYWYFYDPYAARCRENLIDATLVTATLDFKEASALSPSVQLDRERLLAVPELNISLVFGYVVHDEKYADPLEVERALKNRTMDADPVIAGWDTSSKQFLWFWNRLPSIAEIKEFSVRQERGHMFIDVRGVFKTALKPFRLKVYLGPTDLFGPVPAAHFPETLRGMINDDVFIYAGHAGLGENLRISRITDQTLPMSALHQAPDYQVLAYISCYAYTYFDQGTFPAAAWGPGRRKADLLLSGGITYDFGDASLGVMRTLHESLVNAGPVDLRRFFDKETFLVHRAFDTRLISGLPVAR